MILIISAILLLISELICRTELGEIPILNSISDFSDGAAIGMLLVAIITMSRYGHRIRAFKQRLIKRNKEI